MQKTFSIFILGLMVAAGAGCSKKSVEPVGDVGDEAEEVVEDAVETVNQQTTEEMEEMDTSDWKTYREPALGFEIQLPKDWSGRSNVGTDPGNEFEFWKDIMGEVFIKTKSETEAFKNGSFINLQIIVKRDDSTLKDFIKDDGMGITGKTDITNVAGLEAWRDGLPIHYNENIKAYTLTEQVIIKNEKMFYFFDFTGKAGSEEDIKHLATDFEQVLKSFKTYHLEDFSIIKDWIVLNDSNIHFELKYPQGWSLEKREIQKPTAADSIYGTVYSLRSVENDCSPSLIIGTEAVFPFINNAELPQGNAHEIEINNMNGNILDDPFLIGKGDLDSVLRYRSVLHRVGADLERYLYLQFDSRTSFNCENAAFSVWGGILQSIHWTDVENPSQLPI